MSATEDEMSGYDRINKTRFPELGFANFGRGLWRIVALDESGNPQVVGPQYHSKVELLPDLPRYARENWGYSA